ncbi:CBASS cGAMP-activated phospholipase [Pseudomonas aeruginosa]|uniref:CBASS cGAMP-activated phospholipase n=1 Tax=Stutzerimonas frequens TaxID=2968969 RepID=A0AA47DZT5_9GAMM|nr:CBASS cGAMP-activated phospholipase [Stutzerimonas frequens]WAE51498.1 CBASS cGAMP-activated phospholipase [Stutzerimonas frequens]
MVNTEQQRFQILALSGGGFRGLYTAKILADIEDQIGAPIASKFDLIAGTSIGGILALAVALEIPAQKMVDLFEKHGEEIFKPRFNLFGTLRSKYSPEPLKRLLQDESLFGQQSIGKCKHPVIVPAINYSRGEPQLFKTPHHPDFIRDHKFALVDVALATSAAPMYFPRHTFNNNQYVDGGLYANAPGQLAVHEAQQFMGRSIESIYVLAVGTMSSKFTANPGRNRAGGTLDWGGLHPAKTPERLFGVSISVLETLTHKVLGHQLADRYIHIDDALTDQVSKAVALDKADVFAREALAGAGSERSKAFLGAPESKPFLAHQPISPVFYHGPHATKENV